MDSRITINDIIWCRSYLRLDCSVFPQENLSDMPVLLALSSAYRGSNRIIPFFIDNSVPAAAGHSIQSICICNTEDGKMLSEGDWQIVSIDSRTTIRFSDDALLKLRESSKVFVYDNNKYYNVWFTFEKDNDLKKIILHARYATENKHPYSRGVKHDVLSKVMQAVYNLTRKMTRGKEKRVLFLSVTRDEMPMNFQALYEYMVDLKMDERFQIDVVLKNTVGKASSISAQVGLLRLIAKYNYIFLEDYTPFFTAIQPDPSVIIAQLWHAGFGYKAVGYTRFGINGSPNPFYSCHRRYSYAFVGNEALKEIYAEVYGIDRNKIIATGMPRLDHFLDDKVIYRKSTEMLKKYPFLNEKRIVLFAPTYRGLDQGSADYRIGRREQELLYDYCKKENAIIVFKAHHFLGRGIKIMEQYKDLLIDLSDCEIDSLMYISDVLITDYSSCFYDYLLLHRPVLFFIPDEAEYMAERGVCCEVSPTVPGQVCRTAEELVAELHSPQLERKEPLPFMVDMAAEHRDQTSCERIIETVFGTVV